MTRKAHPEFHKALLEQTTYPFAPRHIRHQETRCSHLYRTGAEVYKLRKSSSVYSSLEIKELLVREALASGRRWAPQVMIGMVEVVAVGDSYRLAAVPELPDAVGAVPLPPCPPGGRLVDYALRMKQLSEHHWTDVLVRGGKLSGVTVGRIARYLAQRHSEAPADERAQLHGRPEQLAALAEDLLSETKQLIGGPLSEPMFELMARPLHRFIADAHKLLLRRVKRGRLVHCHGAFVPEHLYAKSLDVQAISPVLSQSKFHLLDAASDVAAFVNGLLLLDADELAQLFQERYASAAKDRELAEVLAGFQVLLALRRGISASEAQAEAAQAGEQREALAAAAQSHFALGVRIARSMTRSTLAPALP
jgi:aminoglycoside phosphotransferase family enzyme